MRVVASAAATRPAGNVLRSTPYAGTNEAMPERGHQLGVRLRRAGLFGRLSGWSIRHPKRALLFVGLVTSVAAPGVIGLKLRTDARALVSQSAPEVRYDQAIRDQFGITDQMVVLIHSAHPDGILNPVTLQLVRTLTAEFATLPEIGSNRVMSLATELSFRFRPGTYVNRGLLELALTNKNELDGLREDLRKIELYTGTLISIDGHSTAILLGVPPACDRPRLYQRVSELLASHAPTRDDLAVTGAPVAESLLGIHILEDLGAPRSWLGTGTRLSEPAGWKTPHNLHELRLLVARRVGLVPLAVLVMMLIFYLSFRSAVAMLLPLPGVATVLVFVFGLMGWLGTPVYLTTAVMPVLLTAISVTNDIYLVSRYLALLRENPAAMPAGLVEETFGRLANPVACTSLAAAIGFLSFGFSPLVPVRAFGVFTGIGALFGLFFSLTAVPALLALLPPRWLLRSRQTSPTSPPAAGFARWGPVIVRWRWWVTGLTLLALVLSPLGLRRLAVQDSWIDGFDPSSDFRRATLEVNRDFYGVHLLLVSFDAPRVATGDIEASAVGAHGIVMPAKQVAELALLEKSAVTLTASPPPVGTAKAASPQVWQSQIEMVFQHADGIHAGLEPEAPAGFLEALRAAGRARFQVVLHSHLQPEVLRLLADLGSFIRQQRQHAVGGVLGPADYLVTTRFMARPDDPQARRLPASAEESKLLWHYYETARGTHRLREVVDTNYWRSLTTVFLKDANFIDTAKLMAEIRAYERERLAPMGIQLGFAGDVAVSQSLIGGIVATQMQSLLWSLAGILAVTTWFGRSLRWGCYCLLPSLLAVVAKFAVMGWLGIPLGVATSMFAAMTLGIGVNCAIHLLEARRQARAANASPEEALNRAVSLTGPPALINTIALSLGFGVLLFSQVPANARLGILLVLGLVNCLVSSLLLLPVMLHWSPPRDRLTEPTLPQSAPR